MKVKFTSARKYEDTKESNSWRHLTQLEVNSRRKELCKELEEEVLDTERVEEGQREGFKRRREEPQPIEKKVDHR